MIELHSKLVENSLLGIESSKIYSLLEDLVDHDQSTNNYQVQNQDHNDLYVYNFNYDNLQLK